MSDKEKKQMEQVESVLYRHGIKMELGGCGCCGSPWFKFEHKGVVLFDSTEAYLDMFEKGGNDE